MWRWSFLLYVFIVAGEVGAAKNDPATKGDLELVTQQIQILAHQMDKRFEQMDRRFDQLLWFVGILTTLSTLAISYIMHRLHKNEERGREIDLPHLALAIKNADPAIKKLLREALR